MADVTSPPTDSILNQTKKVLGLDSEYDVFDQDLILHINSVFATLNQLSLGPDDGFEIEDDSTGWSDYIGLNKNVNSVKTLMYLKVRLLFDPPPTSFAIDAIKTQISELEYRLNVVMENLKHPWIDPSIIVVDELDDIGFIEIT